jgi:hypothetical protein
MAGMIIPAVAPHIKSEPKPSPAPQATLEAEYNWPNRSVTMGYVIRLPTGERMFIRNSGGGATLLPPLPVETTK